MTKSPRRIDLPVFIAAYVLVAGASVAINYPGGLTPDSIDMLVQARFPELMDNWHSPSLPWLWSIFSPPLPQPFGALLVQNLLLFLYPVALLVEKGADRLIPLLLIVLLTAIGGFITKDCTLVAFLLIGLGALDFLKGAPRVAVVIFAALAATLVRPSNFVILFAVGAVWSLIRFRGRSLALSLALAGAVSIATIPAMGLLSKWPFKAIEVSAERSLYIFDAAGISVRTNRDVFASLPNWPTDLGPPSDCYISNRWDDFGWGPCLGYSKAIGDVFRDAGKFTVLKWWISSIAADPLAYLAHRASYSAILLTQLNAQLVPGYPLPMNGSGFEPSTVHTRGKVSTGFFQVWENRSLAWPLSTASMVLLNGVAVLASLLLSACALVRRARHGEGDAIVIVSATLALSNVLMLAFFGVSDETRYLQPTLICGFVCFHAWVRANGRQAKPAEAA